MRVYIPKEEHNTMLYFTRYHDLPIQFDQENFVIVNDPADADIIPVAHSMQEWSGSDAESRVREMGVDISNKLVLILMHTHVSEVDDFDTWNYHLMKEWFPYTKNVAIVDPNMGNTKQIVYNFYWNRHKAYYFDYDQFDLTNRLWSMNATKEMYALNDIPERKQLDKVFLSLNKIRPAVDGALLTRDQYRSRIYSEINRDEDCYYSDWSDPNNIKFIETQQTVRTLASGEVEEIAPGQFAGWWPVAHRYWDTSLVSIYVETLAVSQNSNSRLLSEKTYDPLIHGHFILPFGYSGLVDDIRRAGFQLPTWINYDYDGIVDDEQRFQVFLRSAEKLRRKSRFELEHLYVQDRDMLVHNRNLFRDQPYDRLSKRIFEWLLVHRRN